MGLEGSKGGETVGLVLANETNESNHGEAAILDLLHLEGGKVALAETHGVESATGVDALLSITIAAGDFSSSHGNELNSSESAKRERNLLAEVGSMATLDKGERGSEPVTLAEDLGTKGTGHSEHSPATVDHLRLSETGQVGGLVSEVQGVCKKEEEFWSEKRT